MLHYLHVSLDFFIRIVIFIWLATASRSAYKEFKNEDIEPWIKTRYKLTAIVSLLLSLYNINPFFLPWNVSSGDPDNLLSFIIFGIMSFVALIISIGFLLAWITPNWYKRYLNRGYEPLEDKRYTEEEIIEIIKYLGDYLAEKTNLSAPATRGALKLAIKDEIGPFKPLNQLSYGDLKKIINNSLKKRLTDLNSQNIENIIKEILKQLIRGQSLIMMLNF